MINAVNEHLGKAYKDINVLITGGLGMIGSSLARELVYLGAHVTILDVYFEQYGANDENIRDILEHVEVSVTDVRDREAINKLVQNKDVIFNLAAQVNHNYSIEHPFFDAEVNYLSHLIMLEALLAHNREASIIFPGSRLQFGKIEKLPVDEQHPMRPMTPYALNKVAAENLYRFYHRVYNIPVRVLRIANPYGPRGQMKHSGYCMVNWFLKQAMEGKAIRVFGDGMQLRDYIYIDDLVAAMLDVAIHPQCAGHVYNVGSGQGCRFREMAEAVTRAAGGLPVEYVKWPDNYLNVETGDYVTDISKITAHTGWIPRVTLDEGLQRSLGYYREHAEAYGIQL